MKRINLLFMVGLVMIGLSGCGSSSSGDIVKSGVTNTSSQSGNGEGTASGGDNTGATQISDEFKYVANGHPTATEYGISEDLGNPPSLPTN